MPLAPIAFMSTKNKYMDYIWREAKMFIERS